MKPEAEEKQKEKESEKETEQGTNRVKIQIPCKEASGQPS